VAHPLEERKAPLGAFFLLGDVSQAVIKKLPIGNFVQKIRLDRKKYSRSVIFSP